jgi:predicted GNAT family N-acyltransferase
MDITKHSNEEIYISTVFDYGTPEYDESVALRYDVLRKPLNLLFKSEDLASEFDSIHLGVYNAQLMLLGSLILKPLSEDELKMRQVAVASSWQNKGVGSRLVIEAEKLAINQGYRIISCHARKTAVPFYLRLHYEIVGEEFQEVGIPHFKMIKKLIK